MSGWSVEGRTEPLPGRKERRRYPRLHSADRGMLFWGDRLHPLLDWCPGGFLCAVPTAGLSGLSDMTDLAAPGHLIDARLVVSGDGVTVSDFDVTAEILRFNAEDGTVAARINAVYGVAAGRFLGFFDECLECTDVLADAGQLRDPG